MSGFWYEANEQDCISSIAVRYVVFWETVWNDANNGDLKRLRGNPNILRSGDRVFIPNLRASEEGCATNQRHTFVRKGVPAMLRLFLKECSMPRANLRYVVAIDGIFQEGITDRDGRICVPIPPDAREGLLTVFEGEHRQSYILRLGAMDPQTDRGGVAKRLRNLGFLGSDDGEEAVAVALREFQLHENLPLSGGLDDSTLEALGRAHRS